MGANLEADITSFAAEFKKKYSIPVPDSELWIPLYDSRSPPNGPFFHDDISRLMQEANSSEAFLALMEKVIDIGVLARATDTPFFEALQTVNSFAIVHHGECSLMKLTDRFYFGKSIKYYTFVKFEEYDKELLEGDLGQLLNDGEVPVKRLLYRGGPAGVGKSFYLQYVVRRIRNNPRLRAYYLANPDMFLKPSVDYLLLFLELVYSLAEDIKADSELQQTFKRQAHLIFSCFHFRDIYFKWLLNQTVKYLKKSGKNLVIVLDQENVYDRLHGGMDSSPKFSLHSYLTSPQHGAFVLSSLSFTTETRETAKPTEDVIKFYSDEEILAVMQSRCGFGDRYSMSDDCPMRLENIQSNIEAVLACCGRCPLDIHHMMNSCRAPNDNIKVLCDRFSPDLGPLMLAHEKYFATLDRKKKEAFLILLSIAGRCPPVDSKGLYKIVRKRGDSRIEKESDTAVDNALKETVALFRITPLSFSEERQRQLSLIAESFPEELDEDSTMDDIAQHSEGNSDPDDNRSVEVLIESPTDEDRKYFNISIFRTIDDLETYASIENANTVIDRRFMYIDANGYVHPYSEPAFRALKLLHQSTTSSVQLFNEIHDKLQEVAAGIIYEIKFFMEFDTRRSILKKKALSINLNSAQSSQGTFSKLSVPIQHVVSHVSDMRTIIKKGGNALWECDRFFPSTDFFIICPELDESAALKEFSILSDLKWVPPSLKCHVAGRPFATLILGQLTINGITHGKGDLKICEKPPHVGSGIKDGLKQLRIKVQAFLDACHKESRNPCIAFLWITENRGSMSLYHGQSIVCSSYSVRPLSDVSKKNIEYVFKTNDTTNGTANDTAEYSEAPKRSRRLRKLDP